MGRFYRIWNYIHWDMHDSIAYHVLKFAVYILSWKIIFSWKSLCVEYSAHHFVFQRNTIVIVFVCVCFCKDYIVNHVQISQCQLIWPYIYNYHSAVPNFAKLFVQALPMSKIIQYISKSLLNNPWICISNKLTLLGCFCAQFLVSIICFDSVWLKF